MKTLKEKGTKEEGKIKQQIDRDTCTGKLYKKKVKYRLIERTNEKSL